MKQYPQWSTAGGHQSGVDSWHYQWSNDQIWKCIMIIMCIYIYIYQWYWVIVSIDIWLITIDINSLLHTCRYSALYATYKAVTAMAIESARGELNDQELQEKHLGTTPSLVDFYVKASWIMLNLHSSPKKTRRKAVKCWFILPPFWSSSIYLA